MTAPDTPLFVKTHDFLVWLIGRTQRFPKNLRQSYTLKLENSAFEFQESILMANTVRGAARPMAGARRRQAAVPPRFATAIARFSTPGRDPSASRGRASGRARAPAGRLEKGDGPNHAGALRVLRGGGWNNTAVNDRCANRDNDKPANRNNNTGFRVVCER
ncbi:MAG TPA: hypothetical protein VND64_34340 [Pirellulales bacterium]|nr:hypothetical protein [Pirellulales bacterium]